MDKHSEGKFDEIEKLLQCNDYEFVIKKKKFINIKQNRMAEKFFLKTVNKFDPLFTQNDDEITQNDDETDGENKIKFEKIGNVKFKNLKRSKTKNIKNEELVFDSLRLFGTSNRFDILRDNTKEDITEMINILNTPKRLLKKCKRCNKKRRACILDPSSCKTFDTPCSRCKKYGHCHKSINCQVWRNESKLKYKKFNAQDPKHFNQMKNCEKKGRLQKEKHQSNGQGIKSKPMKISDDILIKIKDRINQLQNIVESKTKIMNSISKEKEMKKQSRREGKFSRRYILKTASKCAKYLAHHNLADNDEYFMTVCHQRMKNLLNIDQFSNLDFRPFLISLLKD